MTTEPQMRRIIIEAPSGERFEADIPCDTKVSKVAVDFFEDRGWDTEQRGKRQRAVVELVNPNNSDETKRLNGDKDICGENVQDGDTLRIFSESIAGAEADPRARQRALIDDHNGLRLLAERDPYIQIEANLAFAPDEYTITFTYPSFIELPHGSEQPTVGEYHQVNIILGAGYPRQAPIVRWLTPIFHPNIHPQNNAVCLGVLQQQYLPGMGLPRLVRMLAEMIQWRNFDASNAFNREAAQWAGNTNHWQQIEALGGYPFIAHQGVAELVRLFENITRPRITFRPLSPAAPGGHS